MYICMYKFILTRVCAFTEGSYNTPVVHLLGKAENRNRNNTPATSQTEPLYPLPSPKTLKAESYRGTRS